jgi:hypothetical protein
MTASLHVPEEYSSIWFRAGEIFFAVFSAADDQYPGEFMPGSAFDHPFRRERLNCKTREIMDFVCHYEACLLRDWVKRIVQIKSEGA